MSSNKRGERPLNALRPLQMTLGFQRYAEGSVLLSQGDTRVLITASLDNSVPDFLVGKGVGWITAEYQMHPRSNPKRRERRDGRERPLGGRAREIQRLIGRALRAAIDLEALGERSLVVDCDVVEADGGTRTASITGGFVAIAMALSKLRAAGELKRPVLRDQVAAISVGHVDGNLSLDLCYAEDSSARVDMNVVATQKGDIIELQGTAEGRAVPRADVDQMVDLGLAGIAELCRIQARELTQAGCDLEALLIKS